MLAYVLSRYPISESPSDESEKESKEKPARLLPVWTLQTKQGNAQLAKPFVRPMSTSPMTKPTYLKRKDHQP